MYAGRMKGREIIMLKITDQDANCRNHVAKTLKKTEGIWSEAQSL